MLAPVLNYSKALKCLIHFSRVGQWPVTKDKRRNIYTVFTSIYPSVHGGVEDTKLRTQKTSTRANHACKFFIMLIGLYTNREKIQLLSASFHPRCSCG